MPCPEGSGRRTTPFAAVDDTPTSAQNWRVAGVDNMGALGLWSELVK